MAQAVKDSFLDLERHRQLLEENVEKLRKSLQHWQTWEAEYEGLKEEIQCLGPNSKHEHLVAIGSDYNGKLVTQTEVDDLLGTKLPRTVDQVINILARRIDYVAQNVNTLQKQVEAAENKLAAATVISQPDARNDEGLPLTEIIEELDEDGNFVSGRTETQGSARGQLLEVLEKAGMKDLQGLKQEQATRDAGVEDKSQHMTEVETIEAANAPSETPMKSVQFVEGTKAGAETQKSQTAKQVEAITKPVKQDNSEPAELPVIPADESPEDAALRREMLKYSMSEVGAVVAELNLEGGSDFSDENYDDDDDNDDETSSMDGDEDEFGRSTRKVVDEDMRRRIVELEERLGFRMMENVGPNPDIPPTEVDENKAPHLNSEQQMVGTPSGAEKKAVRFAENLDISSTLGEVPLRAPQSKIALPRKSPLGEIVERAPPKKEQNTSTISTQKQSRFKSARAAKEPKAPSKTSNNINSPNAEPLSNINLTSTIRTGSVKPVPEGKPLLDSMIERDVPVGALTEPDEFDTAILQQEIRAEYYRTRNRMIQRQGGFMKNNDEENGIIPFSEEEGGPKKVSRFKAARLAKS